MGAQGNMVKGPETLSSATDSDRPKSAVPSRALSRRRHQDEDARSGARPSRSMAVSQEDDTLLIHRCSGAYSLHLLSS